MSSRIDTGVRGLAVNHNASVAQMQAVECWGRNGRASRAWLGGDRQQTASAGSDPGDDAPRRRAAAQHQCALVIIHKAWCT